MLSFHLRKVAIKMNTVKAKWKRLDTILCRSTTPSLVEISDRKLGKFCSRMDMTKHTWKLGERSITDVNDT